VSAVTFIAAVAFLSQLGIESSGWMVAAMALMESPAIVVGVLLSRLGASVKVLLRFSGTAAAGGVLQWFRLHPRRQHGHRLAHR
jgi:hypothetical protein